MIDPEELENLKAKIIILEEENLSLSQSSEELLLINTLFDTIKENQSLVFLYQSVLEKVAILKDIPFCSFLRKNSGSLTLLASYALFNSEVKEGTQLKLEELDLQKIVYEPIFIAKENISAVKQQLFISDADCVCTEIMLIPFNSLLTGECVFLLVDDDLSGDRLFQMLTYLNYVVDRIVERFDIIYYQDELGKFNHELEEKVIERTNELLELNEQLKKEIEERKKSEEKLKTLSHAIEQSPAIIVITNVKGDIEYVNPKFEEVTGYSFGEVQGKNPRVLSSGRKTKYDYQEMWQTITNGKEWRGEFYNKKKNGELYWEAATVSPILNDKNEIIKFIAVKEDITVQNKMTQELIEAKEKAEEMVRLKSYFFANMSHELRTPFVGILGFAEILKDTLENREEREYAVQILKSSKRLTDTLNKILNISRLEFDKVEVKYSEVDVCKLLKSIESFYSSSAKLNNTTITACAVENNFKVFTDPKLLEDILNNLVNNAIKFTENGSISLSASRITDKNNSRLLITVKDTGIGIPEEKQNLIWQEFRQASEGYNRSFEGTGLGLTITKKYVELLGGEISIISEENKGTIFNISVPLDKKEAKIISVEEEQKSTSNLKSKNQVLKKPKLLYVEDDAVALQYISIILKSSYDVESAFNAGTALELVARKEYDILMLDINLGRGMDGLELMQKIREIDYYNRIPIVAVTAYATDSDKTDFLSKGFTHYISKPFVKNQLLDLLAGISKSNN